MESIKCTKCKSNMTMAETIIELSESLEVQKLKQVKKDLKECINKTKGLL